MARLDTTDPEACWPWPGAKDTGGHGQVRDETGRLVMVHRVVYENQVGPVPGAILHHRETCPKSCANPGHLSPMTKADHSRLHATRETCAKGHPFDGRTKKQRTCSICRRASWRRWKSRQT